MNLYITLFSGYRLFQIELGQSHWVRLPGNFEIVLFLEILDGIAGMHTRNSIHFELVTIFVKRFLHQLDLMIFVLFLQYRLSFPASKV